MYACLRETIILPRFGSVQGFINVLMVLRGKSRGYGLLLVDSQFNDEMVRSILPDDIHIRHRFDMLMIFEPDGSCPVYFFHHFMRDFLGSPQHKIWTADDIEVAEEILKRHDFNGFLY